MKARVISATKQTTWIAAVFTACWLLIRAETLWSISARVPTLENIASGFIEDLSVAALICLPVLALSALIALVSARVAVVVALVLFAVTLLLGFAIDRYFVTTLVPLSADLLGYSMSDISTTVSSSGSTLNSALIVCVLILSAFLIATIVSLKKSVAEKISHRGLIICMSILVLLAVLPLRSLPEEFESDIDYYVSVNKSRYLFNRTLEYLNDGASSKKFKSDAYPFLHRIDYVDSLGSHFNLSASYPNIVVIIMEGLGRDFCGPRAPYCGFTPFLDSLFAQSLSWQNGISNAGRTFGAPPSVLGSLPYGNAGLMSYGLKMPGHQTLISLLKPYGYQTNFFYGGNPNFDNLDLFLERQGVGFFLNESNFGAGHVKAFWGFNDNDLFRESLKRIADTKDQRLDIYLTLSTHEPFVCPDSALIPLVEKKLNVMAASKQKDIMLSHKEIFACLTYTDNAIRNLLHGYQKRADFNNTIFIITGDHRLIPVPQDNKIKRFHVPIMIYSPLIKKPQTFSALAAHSDILPSLLALLHKNYAMEFPPELPLISRCLSTDTSFSSNLSLALIRNKNEVRDYISGKVFLSDDRLYKILPDLGLEILRDDEEKKVLRDSLVNFKSASIFALEHNRLDKIASLPTQSFILTTTEQQIVAQNLVAKSNPDEEFSRARELARAKKYPASRAMLKNLLNNSPNYHDARILLARTYAWAGIYDSAKVLLNQTIQRSPNYADSYAALGDVEFWQDQPELSLATVNRGLKANPDDGELLSRKARALIALNRDSEARAILRTLIQKNIDNEIVSQLKRKLK